MCQCLTPEQFGFVLALFYHRQLPPSDSLAPILSLHAPRRPPLGPAGSGRAQTFPRWLLPDTDRRIAKDPTGSDLDEHPLYIQYVTEPNDSFGQINPFLPARRRP